MKISFSRTGIITITAENKKENEVLFKIVNGGGGISIEEKKERADKGGTHAKPSKMRYSKNCPVDGCPHKAKSLGLHMRMMHGIDKTGVIHSTFKHNYKGTMPVTLPVVKTDDGYRLKDMPKKSLLGDDSFIGGRVIS